MNYYTKLTHIFIAVIICCNFANPAFAQNVTVPSGSFADENRDRERFNSQLPSDNIIKKEETEKKNLYAKIYINKIQISGANHLDISEIQKEADAYNNTMANVGIVYEIADKITKLYTDKGYAFSFAFIPVQDVKDGIINIRVIEGFIGKISVNVNDNGILVSKERLAASVRKSFNIIASDKPIMINDLEKAILVLNDTYGLKANIVVSASDLKNNATDIQVNVDVDKLSAKFVVDNYTRTGFGNVRNSFSVYAYNNLFAGDAIRLNYRSSYSDKGLRYYDLYYGIPSFLYGIKTSLSYYNAKTEAVDGILHDIDYESAENGMSASLQWDLLRTRKYSNSLTIGMNFSNSDSKFLGVKFINDKIRTINVTSSWNLKTKRNSLINIDLSYINGIDGLGATGNDNDLRSRKYGSPDFSSINSSISIFSKISDKPIFLAINSDIQLGAGGAAFASRECSYGGEYMGKAYSAGVLGGENCFKIYGEISRAFNIKKSGVIPYAFVDWGYVRQSGTLDVNEYKDDDASSYGAGIRLELPYKIYSDIGIAKHSNLPRQFSGDKNLKLNIKLGINL